MSSDCNDADERGMELIEVVATESSVEIMPPVVNNEAETLKTPSSSKSTIGCCAKLDSLSTSMKFNLENQKVEVKDHSGILGKFRKFMQFVGPGFLVAIAYIDPGNFGADVNAGAQFAYSLLWMMLLATLMGAVVQYLSSKLGIVTENDLAQQCSLCYPRFLRLFLWLMAEVAVISSDIPEILGTAIALNILFGIPLVIGVLITALDTFLFLFLQYASIRLLEAVISSFVFIMSCCFIIEMFLGGVNPLYMLEGLIPFYTPPEYQGRGGTRSDYIYAAIGLMGSVIMPHNLFFHSALVKTRKIPRTKGAIRESMIFNAIECFLALFVSFIINVSLISLSAAVFFYDPDVGLEQVSSLLTSLLGDFSGVVFAVALLASGQSSTITGTFAGQFVMEGFLHINIAPWKRSLITRTIAIIPPLVVCFFFGESASDDLIVLSQVILSIQLPYALIPLLKQTNNVKIMGPFKNSMLLQITTYIISAIVIAANFALLVFTFLGSITFEVWYGYVIFGIISVVALFYLVSLIFLAFLPVDKREEIRTPVFDVKDESVNGEGSRDRTFK